MSAPPEESFHDLWVRYAGEIYRFALYLSGERTMAEDVTAEAFLRLWSSWQRVRWPTVRSYLFAIARNEYLHQLRRTSREKSLDEAIPVPCSLGQEAELREELDQALAAMRQLPELDRAALLLRAQEGLTYDDIAAVLNLPVSTARVKVHRARLRLAQICQRSHSVCLFQKT